MILLTPSIVKSRANLAVEDTFHSMFDLRLVLAMRQLNGFTWP